MWSASKDLKTSYVIKAGPTKHFLLSGPQLKEKSQTMIYRWTFGKDPLKLE